MRLAQLKIELAEKRTTYSASTETTAQYLASWIELLELAPSTILRYRSLLKRHVYGRSLSDVRLCEVESAHVLRFYAEVKALASASTAKKVHSLLHSAFESARHTRVGFSRNPCDIPRNNRPKYKPHHDAALPFDANEEEAFLAACDGDQWEALYVLALDSGMRQAELFALEWRDVDWARRSVEVRQTLKDTENGLAVGETKNRQRRAIVLSEATMDALAAHRRWQLRATALQRLVFPDSSGGYLRRQNFNRRHFAAILAKAERESGLPFKARTFHDLRHTCATLLLQDGESVTRVSQRLGHSTVKTTLDYYAHCVPQDEDRPAARFDQRRQRAIGSRIGSPRRSVTHR